MALNKNHEFEELNGVKCAIVEKNVHPERAAFLKEILVHNNFEIVVVPSAPPKVAAKPAAASDAQANMAAEPPKQDTFTIGVTNLAFNAVNAIFGRLLKMKDGNPITWDYWHQKDTTNQHDVPYYESELWQKDS